MKKNYTFPLLLIVVSIFFCNDITIAQQSLLVNLGSTTCANPDSASFSIISNPLGSSVVLNTCSLANQLPDYNNTFIAYNPKNNKIYINDVRYASGSKIWVMDVGLPDNIKCPDSIPVAPDFNPAYSTNNFEFDNSGNLWSLRNYTQSTGTCLIDQYDILTGNILASKTLQFPLDSMPTDIGNGDLCILPNGRLFATFGRDPSRLYEITNYNDGVGNATATYLQTLPRNTFGIAYLNGQLEVTGTNSIDSCYYFDYNISTNELGAKKFFQNGFAPIDNTSISPVVGATKTLVSAIKLSATSAALVYEIYVQNMGNVILKNINVTEDLGAVFGAANISNVSAGFVAGSNTPGLTLNSSYNGTTVNNLLNDGQVLANKTSDTADYFFKIQVSFTADNLTPGITYYNSAIATATLGSGDNQINVSDSSNNGTADVVDPNKNGIANELGENIPTPYNFSLVPVKFIYNYTNSKDKNVLVEWKISTPVINANKFVVEFSKDGIQWMKAGEVTIDDPEQSSYQFLHQNIFSGNIFYRIKEVDKDGMVVLSTIMKLNNTTDNIINIFPNPAKNFIQVNTKNPVQQFNEIELSDILGRKIFNTKTNNESTVINTSGLSDGTYILKVIDNNNVSTQKIVIRH